MRFRWSTRGWLYGLAALAFWAPSTLAQAQAQPSGKPSARFALNRTDYSVQAGGAVALEAPAESVEFLGKASSRAVTANGSEGAGIVVGPNMDGDKIMIAASLTTPPGQYAVDISAFSESGEGRAAAVSLTVSPLARIPSTASRPPVVLLNGWQFGVNFNSWDIGTCPVSSGPSDTFGSLATDLESHGVPKVFFFDNCVEGKDWKIEDLGNKLGQVLDLIRYDDGTLVPQVDLVAHSMGGLIIRAYLSGLQTDSSLRPPQEPRVRKAVFIATPNFGSFKAVDLHPDANTQTSEMLPASGFLWRSATWNQRGDDLRGVDALALVGNQGTWSSGSGQTWSNASDGVVSVTSASLNFARDPSRTRILPYCHIDSASLAGLFIDCSGRAIAKAVETRSAVVSFLGDTADWLTIGTPTTPSVLSYGGVYVGVQDSAGTYVKDLTSITFNGVALRGNPYYVFAQADFLQTGLGLLQFASNALGDSFQASRRIFPGTYTPLLIKFGPSISAATPILGNPSGQVRVASGHPVVINGYGFGQACSSCGVWVYPGATPLSVSSWTDSAITALLPGTVDGFAQLLVQTIDGFDFINIMVEAPPATISLSTQQLRFAHVVGSAPPAPQTVVVSNGGGGTFRWSATTNVPWLAYTTTPGLLTVSPNPTGLSLGTHTGTISVAAADVANSPQTVSVTLTVAPGQLTLESSGVSFIAPQGSSAPMIRNIPVSSGASAMPIAVTVASPAPWLSVTSTSLSTPATLVITANPAGLAPGSYSGQIRVASNMAANIPTLTVNLNITAADDKPTVTSVVNGASFLPGIQGNSWIVIRGTNLSNTTRSWDAQTDIVNGLLPMKLDGVRVTVNGRNAAVYYVSPGQINVLAPTDPAMGPAQVVVTNGAASSPPFSATLQRYSPALFTFGPASRYVAATHADGSYIGPVGLFGSGVATRPATTGETIVLYGTGFGPTNPPVPTDRVFSGAAPLTDPVVVTVGGVPAQVVFAGMTSNGVVQLNITIPPLPSGDHSIETVVGGTRSQQTVSITVDH